MFARKKLCLRQKKIELRRRQRRRKTIKKFSCECFEIVLCLFIYYLLQNCLLFELVWSGYFSRARANPPRLHAFAARYTILASRKFKQKYRMEIKYKAKKKQFSRGNFVCHLLLAFIVLVFELTAGHKTESGGKKSIKLKREIVIDVLHIIETMYLYANREWPVFQK